MGEKPSYLGLLNAIALAETRAHAYLVAWADVTPSIEVRAVLLTVAAREGEHGMSFAKRINELGFEVRDQDDPNFAGQLELAKSDRSDLEKIEQIGALRFDTGDGADIFDGVFADHSIDIQTGELLGRYITEERDSLRRLRACRELLRADVSSSPPPRLEAIEEKLDSVARAVDELRQIVCAQAMPTNRA